MKKKPFLLLLLLVFSFVISLVNFQNVLGYETETNTKLNLYHNVDNDDISGGIATITTYSYFDQPLIDGSTINYQYSIIELSDIAEFSEFSTYSQTLNNPTNIWTDTITEQTIGSGYDAQIEICMRNYYSFDEFATSVNFIHGYDDGTGYYHKDGSGMLEFTMTFENLHDCFENLDIRFCKYQHVNLVVDAGGVPVGDDPMSWTIKIGLFTIYSGDSVYDLYSIIDWMENYADSTIVRLNFDMSGTTATRIKENLLCARFPYMPCSDIFIEEIEYTIDGLTHIEENEYAILDSVTNANSNQYIYSIWIVDASIFDHYIENRDIIFSAQTFSFEMTRETTRIVYIWLEIVAYESIFPSAYNFKLNEMDISDLQKGQGQLIFTDYENTLEFTADISNIRFDFDITDYYTYEFDLNIVSHSYLKSLLSLDFDSNLIVSKVEFMFSSDILHSYVQNIDQGSEHIVFPSQSWISDSTCKIEVILEENIYVDLEYQTNNQLSTDIDINDNVQYEIDFQATRNFDKWYSEIDYNVISYQCEFGGSPISLSRIGSLYFIDKNLLTNDIVTFTLTIDVNYSIYYEILSETQNQISLKIYYSSDIEVNDVDLRIQLPFYFQSWNIGVEDSNNILTIEDIDVSTTQNYIIADGEFQTPCDIDFSSIYNTEAFTIYDGFEENINYAAIIDDIGYKIKYGKIYPENDWNSLELFNNTDYQYSLTDQNEFYTQNGFQAGYLYFKCNPVISFETISLLDKITLNINMSLNASNIIIVFEINSDEHYELNNKMNILEVSELSENLYYIYYDLSEGMNTIDIYIKVYSGNSIFTYILIGLGIAAAIGLVYLMKKRKAKSVLKQ
jgi:hypothetical protein